MTAVANFLITSDRAMDYIPGASSVNNSIDILIKIFIDALSALNLVDKEGFDSDSYFFHISEKSYGACLLLIIPGVNVVVALFKRKGSNREIVYLTADLKSFNDQLTESKEQFIEHASNFRNNKSNAAAIQTLLTEAKHLRGLVLSPPDASYTQNSAKQLAHYREILDNLDSLMPKLNVYKKHLNAEWYNHLFTGEYNEIDQLCTLLNSIPEN